MTMTRHWLDWSQPCLPAAAQWLIDTLATSRGRLCELHHVVCVMPGKRAGRLLLEHLLRECDQRDMHLVPPQTMTPGVMVDALLATAPGTPVASAAERVCAWAVALREAPHDVLAHLLAKRPPDDDVLAWHELASTIQRLHVELAGQKLSFDDAAQCAERMEMFGEGDRWRSLQSIHARYVDMLTNTGLACPHALRAQTQVPAQSLEDNAHVVMIGIVELNAVQRDTVQQLTEHGVPCSALVHAPEAMADRFDALGCVKQEPWAESHIELDEQHIIVADRPHDQAQEAMRFIASFNGRYAADEMVIGVGDAGLCEPVQQAGRWAGVSVHSAEGVSLTRTLPYRLLEVIASWLNGMRFADFASLLRHPDIERWLQQSAPQDADDVDQAIKDWIGLLDAYFSEHLHQRLDGAWLGDSQQQRRLKQIYTSIEQLLRPLQANVMQTLGDWSEPILAVLRDVYGQRETLQHHTREACLTVRDVLAELSNVDPQLQLTTDAATALRLTLRSAAEAAIAEPSGDDEIEMLGWLELHLDPAPAMIVLGVNDGQIPSCTVADAFLPDALRSALGLMNNARRYARDAYLLQATAHSRPHMKLVAGRRASDGEPLAPSRLLMACEVEKLPQRVAQLCDEKHAHRWPLPLGSAAPADECRFVQAPAPPLEPPAVDHLSVTSFRNYLACPYRFWLGSIERLRPSGDAAVEMDPLIFGSFAHSALECFGRDETIRDSADPATIAASLLEHVQRASRDRFGKRPAPAVRVQLERLKRRLEAFAQVQAQLRSEGWVIETCEFRLPEQTYLDIPGQEPMRISGIIDRIDRHADTGKLRLIDYKTSESGATPFQVHHGSTKYKEDRWLDLQLPLYRFLAARHEYANAEVGYIVLPKNANDVAYLPGEWSDEQFAIGIDKAREVVLNIRAGKFQPNPDYRSSDFDDFATICRVSVLGGEDDSGEEDGE